jgi:3-hydroxyisobutyrate dehydrogenase-like beta-hydroxyacid dehydrogenase
MPDRSVGMIGLGIMGSAMAANLVTHGYRVVGFDVLPRRRALLRRAGGHPASSVADVAAAAPIVVSSLPSAGALRDVAGELAASAAAATIVIETSTLPIGVKEQARVLLQRRGITLLDCPLSGTGAQARNKDLVVYASGDRRAVRRAVPVFEGFARVHYHVGPFGAGSKMKFVANLLVAIHNVAAAEAFVLARRAGLDAAMTYEVIANSAGASRMLQMRGPMMVKRRYGPATMKLDVWQKDMQVIAEFAREVGAPTPLFSTTAPLYEAARSAGGDRDTAAVHDVVERLTPGGRTRVRRVR